MKQLPSIASIKHQYPISSIEKAISLQLKTNAREDLVK